MNLHWLMTLCLLLINYLDRVHYILLSMKKYSHKSSLNILSVHFHLVWWSFFHIHDLWWKPNQTKPACIRVSRQSAKVLFSHYMQLVILRKRNLEFLENWFINNNRGMLIFLVWILTDLNLFFYISCLQTSNKVTPLLCG